MLRSRTDLILRAAAPRLDRIRWTAELRKGMIEPTIDGSSCRLRINSCDTILDAIGDTPLVRINKLTKGVVAADVFAKLETFNPGNSIKDRMAVKMIEDAERAGKLRPGGTIIEGTSGNTGMGLAIAAVVKGYKCIFTTTDKQSKEKVDALRAFGAEVIVCPTNVEPEDPRSYYSVSSRLERETPNSWKANQYDNLSNSQAHYEQTGPEIWEQTDGRIDHLVSGVGTGGTICGVARFSEGAKAERQDVGHRHLRVGVQEIQRDRQVRQERDLSLHHRRDRRRLPAAERGLLAHRSFREGDRQGCRADDAPDYARGGHLRRQFGGRRDGGTAAACRSVQGRRNGRRHLSRSRLALPGQDVQRRVDAREGLPRTDGPHRAGSRVAPNARRRSSPSIATRRSPAPRT